MLIDGYGPGHSKGLATRRPPNKELKLTSVEPIGRSQLNSGVRRTCWACEAFPASTRDGRTAGGGSGWQRLQ